MTFTETEGRKSMGKERVVYVRGFVQDAINHLRERA
jgi:hypothetical protein